MTTSAMVLAVHDQVLASGGSSGDDGGFIGFIFLLSGFAFYALMYFRYRNADKRHRHESETEATLLNMKKGDTFVRSKTGMSNSRMSGANSHEVRGARRKFF
ncbi:hypothetical protein [Demequina oxidasica]|uniref:hypothetical protein n=1 Tax=Demequina oxidasica TaxID=676199 RepID=UPI0007842166|nr:hypothetical protein [Demequina oxidasica]